MGADTLAADVELQGDILPARSPWARRSAAFTLAPIDRRHAVVLDARGRWQGVPWLLCMLVMAGVTVGFLIWDAKTSRVPAREMYDIAIVMTVLFVALGVHAFWCIWITGSMAVVDRGTGRVEFTHRPARAITGKGARMPVWPQRLERSEHPVSKCELRVYRARYLCYHGQNQGTEVMGWMATLSLPERAMTVALTDKRSAIDSYVKDLATATRFRIVDTGCTVAWREPR